MRVKFVDATFLRIPGCVHFSDSGARHERFIRMNGKRIRALAKTLNSRSDGRIYAHENGWTWKRIEEV